MNGGEESKEEVDFSFSFFFPFLFSHVSRIIYTM